MLPILGLLISWRRRVGIVPRLTLFRSPSPRELRPGSSSMVALVPIRIDPSIIGVVFGMMCFRAMCITPDPRALDASTWEASMSDGVYALTSHLKQTIL
jgi:hypothetical protein